MSIAQVILENLLSPWAKLVVLLLIGFGFLWEDHILAELVPLPHMGCVLSLEYACFLSGTVLLLSCWLFLDTFCFPSGLF